MLRVGLTGGLGSGKSTVGRMLAEHGAYLLQADEIGREMMRPGRAVYAAIVERFGPCVVRPDGDLDRAELARLAFGEGRVEELNAIVHPAVIARQAEMTDEIGGRDPQAIVVVESALIFETRHGSTKDGGGGGWRERFDRILLVVAPEELKVARFVERASAKRSVGEAELAEMRAEARRRLGQQLADERKMEGADYVLQNAGTVEQLGTQVDGVGRALAEEASGS